MFYEGAGALLVAVVLFILTEKFPWHRPSVEFFFWFLALQLGVALGLLAHDSPVRHFVTLNRSPQSLALIFGVLLPLYAAATVQTVFEARLTSFNEHRGGSDGASSPHRRLAATRQRLAEGDPAEAAQQSKATASRRSRRGSSGLDAAVADEQEFIARSKQVYVTRVLDRLVYSSQLRRLAAWARGQIDDRQEALRKVLQEASPAELNRIVEGVNVSKLLRHGSNGRAANRLLAHIMDERSEQLTTIARAAVLHGLMRTQSLPFIAQEMRWAADLMTGARGAELTLLKNMLDSAGDFNNLHKLVFADLNDDKLRRRVLRHIEEQAAAVLAASNGLAPLKVLSDVDDTLYCSGGQFPAGADARYPRHALYPGVLALFEELDQHARHELQRAARRQEEEQQAAERRQSSLAAGKQQQQQPGREVKVTVLAPWSQGGRVYELVCPADAPVHRIQQEVQARFMVAPARQELVITAAPKQPPPQSVAKRGSAAAPQGPQHVAAALDWSDGNLVFVSARPHVWQDVSENGSYRRFRQLVSEGKMHAVPTMLTGSLYHGSLAVWLRLFDHARVMALDAADAAADAAGAAVQRALSSRKGRSPAAPRKSGRRSARRGSVADQLPRVISDDVDEQALADEAAPDSSPDLEPHGSLRRGNTSAGGTRVVANRNWEAVGRTKVERVEQFAQLYPEYRFVFFGDNAQGDLLAAELLAKHDAVGAQMAACFVHQVQEPQHETLLSALPAEMRDGFWRAHKIFFFETYVEAARLACQQGLISARGLHRVGLAVHDELLEYFIRFPHRDWALVLEQTKRDIRLANKFLRKLHAAQSGGGDSDAEDGAAELAPALQIPVPLLPYAMDRA